MKLPLLSLILFLTGVLQSQADQKTWFFGGGTNDVTTGLRFTGPDNVPLPYNDVRFPLNMQENNVIVTDPGSGVVQFYSDGLSVIDRSNQVMPNGGDLSGGPSSMYGTSIVFDPAGCNRYYLFYCQAETNPPPREAYYSVLDLDLPGNGTLANPQGDIDPTQKNISFLPPGANATEGLYAIPKADRYRESWLFIGQRNGNLLTVYDVSATGVSLHATYEFTDLFPTFTTAEEIFGIRLIYQGDTDTTGRLVITPARTQTIVEMPIGYTTFNTSTGFLEGPVTVISEDREWTYGLAFSRDGSKLYFSDYNEKELYQYDFTNSVLTLVATAPHSGRSGGLLLAPDDKVYWADRAFNNNFTRIASMSSVNSPNEPGLACDFEYDTYVIGGNPNPFSIAALPTFGSFPPPSRVEQIRAADCDNDNGSATITRFRGQPPFTVQWDNGETGTTAFQLAGGVRQVTITDVVGCTSVLQVMIDGETDTIATPEISLDGLPCTGETITLSSPELDSNTYQWSGPNGFFASTPSVVLTDLSDEQLN